MAVHDWRGQTRVLLEVVLRCAEDLSRFTPMTGVRAVGAGGGGCSLARRLRLRVCVSTATTKYPASVLNVTIMTSFPVGGHKSRVVGNLN